jgi:hypothetical protein
MALSRFWLLNGSKKKGKKSVKKVAKKVIKKVTKKSKKVSLLPSVIKTSTIKHKIKKVKRTRPTKVEKVFIPEIVTETKKIYRSNPIKKSKGVKTMAKKRAKRVKLTKNKNGIFLARNWNKSVGKVHRISAKYDRAGILRTSKKAKITRKSYRLNPINVKSITKNLKPMAILTATGVGSIVALNKVMPMIPYIKNLNGVTKAVAKVGIGAVASMLVKKYLKNDMIANGLLLGCMISALAQYVNLSEQGQVLIPQTTQGIKVMGNPLSFGRPKTPLGTPNFSMNGIKVTGVNGIKLTPKTETTSGIERW